MYVNFLKTFQKTHGNQEHVPLWVAEVYLRTPTPNNIFVPLKQIDRFANGISEEVVYGGFMALQSSFEYQFPAGYGSV